MTSLYAAIAPHFTQDLLTPELKVGFHDEGGSWPFVAASLSQRLPLRNIEWRNLVGQTKAIDKLPITFVAQSELEALPLVCLYLVKCEDLEHYRASAKARLAAWVERMNAAKVEWMVLYVPLGTRARASGSRHANASSVYKKIFDKIRADFAHKRPSLSASGSSSGGAAGASAAGPGERICKIEILEGNSIAGAAPGQHQQHEAQWSELLLRLRHCILDAFQIKCSQYEDDVRVLDAKRTVSAPGWDFGAFFLAKERLALMYQQTHLLDDAIRHLDELDAIFLNLRETSETQFSPDAAAKRSFKADDAIFTTAPLALDLRATQAAIAANRASAHVIQLHCFCRQLRTLYLMGHYPQLLMRAAAFIPAFFDTLVALSRSSAIAPHQPYQWAIGACLEVAYACELSWNGHGCNVSAASAPAHVVQATSPEVMARHLGDILYLARRLLVRFGRTCARGSPPSLPIAHACDADGALDADAAAADPRAWYDWLERMVASQCVSERYERCVWEMSHLASLHYLRAGRHRFAVFLGAECAKYHVRHREFESASRLFRSHARQCEEDKWWTLVGDCVRSICSAELALGRAAEAVAACFSMLASTQDAQTAIGREYLETMLQTLVQRVDQHASTTPLRMGELLKPTLAVETMQSGARDLEYGDVRVTLCIANCFPAGIHMETLRVRFAKQTLQRASAQEPSASEAPSPIQRRLSSSSSSSSGLTDVPRLHSLVLSDDSGELQREDAIGVAPSVSLSDKGAPLRETSRKSVSMDRQSGQDDVVDAAGESEDDVLVLEESNVYLYEHASVTLVFRHAGLDVGRYVCRGIDCVVAGNTFCLGAGAATGAFEVPRRESSLRIAVEGPPLLTPQTIEQLCVTISAELDTVADGVLELTAAHCSDSDGEDGDAAGLVQFLRAELQTPAMPPPSPSTPRGSSTSGDSGSEVLHDRLLLSIPPLAPGETLVYRVWLAIGDVDPLALGGVPVSTVSAALRYQHVTATETSVALRRVEAMFQLLRPLDERVRLQRVDARTVVAVALTCNSACGLVLRDYRLALAGSESIGQGDSNSGVTSHSRLQVAQDPNGRLRNTALRPNETIHFAFTLRDTTSRDGLRGSEDAISDDASLVLALEYASAVVSVGDCTSDSGDESAARAQQQPAMRWQSELVVRIPLEDVRGVRFRIDVEPRGTLCAADALRYEAAVGDEVAFSVTVRAFGRSAPGRDGDAGAPPRSVLLCLDDRSERDWILLGKARERLELHDGGESDGSCLATTLKRFISTRVGRLRFPSFHLCVRESAEATETMAEPVEDRVPRERVLFPQRTMQVRVA